MVHASLRAVGPVVSGAEAIIAALRDAIGPDGTLLVYCDWEQDIWDLDEPDDLSLTTLTARPEARETAIAFNAASARASRDYGALPELIRTLPGAIASANPGARCAAIGPRAGELTAGHALDYGYGEASPFARLVAAGGKVLMLGAPRDTMTLLHHAEHLATVPDKRRVRVEYPFAADDGRIAWRWAEEFNTGVPVIAGLADDYFAEVVTDFLATGEGRTGKVGNADCVLVPADGIVRFAVDWLESR